VIDPKSNRVVDEVAVGARPRAVATSDGAVWVANADGTVTRIDPETNTVAETIRVGGHPTGVAVAHGRVWVTVG
jgi:YVTN family beta-propeller protein